MDLAELVLRQGMLDELVGRRVMGSSCPHASLCLHLSPCASEAFSQALFHRRRSDRSVLIDSADVVRSTGIKLDATSPTFRTSRSDAVPVTALGHTRGKVCLARPPACDVRLGRPVPAL